MSAFRPENDLNRGGSGVVALRLISLTQLTAEVIRNQGLRAYLEHAKLLAWQEKLVLHPLSPRLIVGVS